MQLHEIHPSLVHLPIALLPASLAADAVGLADRNNELANVGRFGIALTAGTAALAAVSGLIAQEEVEVDEAAYDLLATHRTLNLGVLGLTTAMAVYRAGRGRAGAGYLAAGLIAVGVTIYSAYLGGRMVYGHGMGVEPADGLAPDHAPPLGKAQPEIILQRIGQNLRTGFKHVLEQFRNGDLVPALSPKRPASDPAGSTHAERAWNGRAAERQSASQAR